MQLLPEWTTGVFTLYATMPSRQFMPARVRALLDFLAENTNRSVSACCRSACLRLPSRTEARPSKSHAQSLSQRPGRGRSAEQGSALTLLDEGALDDEVTRRGGIAFLEAALFQQFLEFGQHGRAAAEHDAVGLGVEIGQADVLGKVPLLIWVEMRPWLRKGSRVTVG